MLKLTQYMKGYEFKYPNITDREPIKLNIDTDLLDKDIIKIKDQLSKAKNKYNIANLKIILDYLNKVKRNTRDNQLEIGWIQDRYTMYSYPVNLKPIREYDVDPSDYIELHNETMIRLDFTDIIDIMAFDYIHRDFGYEHQDIEKLLEKCGISGSVNPKVFKTLFEEENLSPFELSKTAKMEDSPYIDSVNKTIKNYFGTKEFLIKNIKDMYKPVIESSANTALNIIAYEIYNECIKDDMKIKLISCGETTITFMINDNSNFDIDKLFEHKTLRAFGRNFEIKPSFKIL